MNHELAIIAPYVSSTTASVFSVSGLPEEVIAVLFAFYSRSPGGLRENLARLLADQTLDVASASAARPLRLATEKARAFHEKWVVGYGHASVAEHAVVHLAVEGCSMLTAKAIEDMRLGSFTEKSTRYVVFDKDAFVMPGGIEALSPVLATRYQRTCELLTATYGEMMPVVMDAVAARNPGANDAAIRAQACDALRGLLPASARTNLGITANARALGGLLTKMLSSPMTETRAYGEEMLAVARGVTPTLLKYVAHNPFRARQPRAGMGHWAPVDLAGGPVRILDHDRNALGKVALLLQQEATGGRYEAADVLDGMTEGDALAIVAEAVEGRGAHDALPRAFEAASITVELVLDFGAYRDLQRHRLLTPTVPLLGCALGYTTPSLVRELGLADGYEKAMAAARATWEQLAEVDLWAAQYVVPLGYRVRTLWTMNLRELAHVIELRSAKPGHPSYRRVAQELYRRVVARGVHPWLAGIVGVDLNDYALAR